MASIALKSRYEELAARVKPVLDGISNVSLILLIILITAANIDKVLEVFGTRGILAALLFIALGFGIGWLLGGPGKDTRRVLALGTGQRNIAAALVVGIFELQRFPGGRDGHRRRDSRLDHPPAACSCVGRSLTRTVCENNGSLGHRGLCRPCLVPPFELPSRQKSVVGPELTCPTIWVAGCSERYVFYFL